jgi:hypothetical protein
MADDDALIEELVERIVAEAEAMPRVCPWCCATLGDESAGFCNSHCAEQYRRKILPRPGREQTSIARPAPAATRKAMALAVRAGRDRLKWLREHPEAQA